MKSIFQVFWPLAIIFLLAILSLRSGGTSDTNPLSDQSLENWFSVTKR